MSAQLVDEAAARARDVLRRCTSDRGIRASGTRDRVRWDDGQESTIRPAAGSARTTPPAERHQVEAPGPEAGPTRRRGAGRTRKGS